LSADAPCGAKKRPRPPRPAKRAASPTAGAWLPAEQALYAELTGRAFPGEGSLTPADLFAYE
jgi:hypothetical protein